jgi:SAM-dependent methyltransferase
MRWGSRYRQRADEPPGAPSAWVMRHALALPDAAVVLDLAAGRGRHALPLAAAGYVVVAVDLVEVAVAALVRDARGGNLGAVVADAAALPIRARSLDAVLCVNYLDRTLFPHLAHILRPGGHLIVETFTVAQRTLGRGPRRDAHLLELGELPTLVVPLEVIDSFEGLVRDAAGERYAAGIVAVKPKA